MAERLCARSDRAKNGRGPPMVNWEIFTRPLDLDSLLSRATNARHSYAINDRAADAMMGALFGELDTPTTFAAAWPLSARTGRRRQYLDFGRLSLTWTGGAGSGPTRSVHWTWANPGLLLLVTDGLFLVPILHH